MRHLLLVALVACAGSTPRPEPVRARPRTTAPTTFLARALLVHEPPAGLHTFLYRVDLADDTRRELDRQFAAIEREVVEAAAPGTYVPPGVAPEWDAGAEADRTLVLGSRAFAPPARVWIVFAVARDQTVTPIVAAVDPGPTGEVQVTDHLLRSPQQVCIAFETTRLVCGPDEPGWLAHLRAAVPAKED